MDISTINPLMLPSVSLAERNTMPDTPGIYFVYTPDTMLYIGKARRMRARWKSTGHHKYGEISVLNGVRLAWLSIDDESLLNAIETACINHFAPILNSSATSEITLKMEQQCNARLRIREFAEQQGLNMSQLQRQSGVTMPSVRRYWYNTRDGKRDGPPLYEIDLRILAALGRVLGQPLGVLISDEGDEPGPDTPLLLAA